MNDKLHVIITGNTGKTIRIPMPRKRVIVGSISAGVLVVTLTISSIYAFSILGKQAVMSQELKKLRYQTTEEGNILAKELKQTQAEMAQIAALKDQQFNQFKEQADKENKLLSEELALLKEESYSQIEALKTEKKEILSTAVNELQEKSMVLDTIMENIGVKLKTKKSSKSLNSGGPFIEHDPGLYDDLLLKVDAYEQQVRYLPLGRPFNGRITSYFGKRQDPINNKVSYHEGIDIKGRRGVPIHATGDGVVIKAYVNSSYGKFVKISHRNGYTTSFAHMDKYFVKEGEKVKRGQIIGHVGNTGRSTGSHLHYELRKHGTPLNPLKFMQVSKLTIPTVKTVKVCKPTKIIVAKNKGSEKK